MTSPRPSRPRRSACGQGLTLVHLSAQPELFLKLKTYPAHPLIPPDTHRTPPKQPLNATPRPQKELTLSLKVNECKPLPVGPVPGSERQCDGGCVRRAGANTRPPFSST